MNYQTSKKGQQGQALILIALAAVGLFAFSALAIDGSRSFSNKRHAQNAADTAVLTAALRYVRNPTNATTEAARFDDAKAEALKRIKSNAFDPANNSTNSNVQIYIQRCDETTDLQTGGTLTCEGIETAHASEYIRVRIVSTIPTTFGRVIGRETLISAAEAIARVQGNTSNSTGGGTSGAAMVATRSDSKDQCFLVNGKANLETHDSGIFVNCSGNQSLFINGDTTFTLGGDAEVVGCNGGGGSSEIKGGYEIKCKQPPKVVDANTYASVPTMPAVPTCNKPGGASGGDFDLNPPTAAPSVTVKDGTVTLTEGNFNSIIANNGTINMSPGTYCISGNFNVQGNTIVNGTGTVKIVLPNADFNVASGRVYTFDGLEVFTVDNDFQIQGTLTANRLRFYSSGSGESILNAQSSITSPNAYFYLHKGPLTWNGNTKTVLSAPPATGDPFPDPGGVLVYMPWHDPDQWGNPVTKVDLNGGSNALLYGTFLMPSSEVKFNGGTTFELHSQIIAYQYIVNGGGKIDIYYLANDIISPPNVTNPTIELTK